MAVGDLITSPKIQQRTRKSKCNPGNGSETEGYGPTVTSLQVLAML